jgi:hypothetical protein
VENHNAEIRAHNLREWFSTGFLKPFISTALPRFAPLPRVHRHLADASESLAARRFRPPDRFMPDLRLPPRTPLLPFHATVAVDST